MSKAEFQTRFQKQIGKNALFPFAFHCTGMPISASANRLRREIESGNTSSH
jgi:leucyl-tRNA synthetase